jgi:hypothetical protein
MAAQMIHNVRLALGLFVGASLFGAPWPALAVTSVTVTDSTATNIPCGNLTSLSITSTAVAVTADGACLDTGTPVDTPTVVDHTVASPVLEGNSANIILDALAVVALNASGTVTATKLTNPSIGSVAISGTTATYSAPAPGTLSSNTQTSFNYRITDQTGGTDDGTVTLTVQPNAAPAGSCVPSATVICKGDLTGFTSQQAILIEANTVHVWRLPSYDGTTDSFSIVQGSNQKELSASTTQNNFSMGIGSCRKEGSTAGITLATTTTISACGFSVGSVVFFNVKPNTDGQSATYDFNWNP